ncbi:MAG: hypothetical protein EOM72_11645 [Opitutae bacterium]|nr:hypothetical protein [Opitutae bacterium]
MNPTPEQVLQQFRLPPPSAELRTRVLAASRTEWNAPAPVSAWTSLRRPIQAIAASLVLLAAGNWANHRLAAPSAFAAAQPAQKHQPQDADLALLPVPRFMTTGNAASPAAISAALQSRHTQMRNLVDACPTPPPAPAPNGQTRQFRHFSPRAASCC